MRQCYPLRTTGRLTIDRPGFLRRNRSSPLRVATIQQAQLVQVLCRLLRLGTRMGTGVLLLGHVRSQGEARKKDQTCHATAGGEVEKTGSRFSCRSWHNGGAFPRGNGGSAVRYAGAVQCDFSVRGSSGPGLSLSGSA
jgi:hypothetical protein